MEGGAPCPDFRPMEIHARIGEADEPVSLTFQLLAEFHTMQRAYDDDLGRTLQRLAITCRSKLQKKTKKAGKAHKKSSGKDSASEAKDALDAPTLSVGGDELDATCLRNFEIRSGMLLCVGSLTFTVVRNPPTVTALGAYPRTLPYVGCPVLPQVSLEFADDFECMWACETSPRSGDFRVVGNGSGKLLTPSPRMLGCKLKLFCTALRRSGGGNAGDESAVDVRGRAVVFYLSGPVQQPQPLGGFSAQLTLRSAFCSRRRAGVAGPNSGFADLDALPAAAEPRGVDELRVLSFNILAEPYATSVSAVQHLYPYCNTEFLQTEFRIQRVLAELVASDADVIALQECDLKTFENYLLPALGRIGYTGHFTHKGATEGCAVFTHRASCRVLQRIDLPLKKVLRDAPHLARLYQLRPDLRSVIGGKLGTIAQITVIEVLAAPGRAVVVANTHLFYHPLACFLRVLQAHAVTVALEEVCAHLEQRGLRGPPVRLQGQEEPNAAALQREAMLEASLCEEGASLYESEHAAAETLPVRVGCIFLGDFNSDPPIATIRFLTQGCVTSAELQTVWASLCRFYWGKPDTGNTGSAGASSEGALASVCADLAHMAIGQQKERVEDDADPARLLGVLRHGLELESAAGFPAFSNYTAAFKDCLDYVMVQKARFQVLRVAPFPSEEVLSATVALPSAVFPSDHLSLMVDLRVT